jgi:hypothetical protein
MGNNSLARLIRFLGVLLFALGPHYALGQSPEPARAGLDDFAVSVATITSPDGRKNQVREGSIVRVGDAIETDSAGEVHLKMEDGGFLGVRPNTVLQIASYQARGESDDRSTVSLLRGALRSVTGWIGKLNTRGYRITTPTVTIGIRGTDHETVHIAPDSASAGEIAGTHDQVYRGATFIERDGQILEIPEGRAGYAGLNGKMELHEKVPVYLERRRTKNDERIERYSREIEHHIEEKLRQTGHLKPNESARKFFERKKAISPSKTLDRAPGGPQTDSKRGLDPTHTLHVLHHSIARTHRHRIVCVPTTIMVAGKPTTIIRCRQI